MISTDWKQAKATTQGLYDPLLQTSSCLPQTGNSTTQSLQDPLLEHNFHNMIFFLNSIIHFIIPFGKFRPPYLGKTTAAARAALPSPTGACWVFSCFCNPPNSDMSYRIFNVLITLMCAYTHEVIAHRHTELGTPTNESAQHFLTRKKISQMFLVLLDGAGV